MGRGFGPSLSLSPQRWVRKMTADYNGWADSPEDQREALNEWERKQAEGELLTPRPRKARDAGNQS